MIWQDAEPRGSDEKQKCKDLRQPKRSAFEANEIDKRDSTSSFSNNEFEHEADKTESASDDEADALLFGETSDSEEKSALAEILGAKHKARSQIKFARRTFAQAKPTVKQLKLSR